MQFFQIENLQHKLDQERASNAKKINYPKLLELINNARGPLQLPGVKLSSLTISYLNLDKSNLRGCDFSFCKATEVSFAQANI